MAIDPDAVLVILESQMQQAEESRTRDRFVKNRSLEAIYSLYSKLKNEENQAAGKVGFSLSVGIAGSTRG